MIYLENKVYSMEKTCVWPRGTNPLEPLFTQYQRLYPLVSVESDSSYTTLLAAGPLNNLNPESSLPV